MIAGINVPTKWLAIGGLAIALVLAAYWLISRNATLGNRLAAERAAHAQTQRAAVQSNKEAARLAEAAQARYRAVRDAFREIENAKDDCKDSAAGRIAIERVRQILRADGADRP